MDLNAYRKRIDEIDDELVRLFAERMEVAAGIAAFRTQINDPVRALDDIQVMFDDDHGIAGVELLEFHRRLILLHAILQSLRILRLLLRIGLMHLSTRHRH